MIIYSSYLRKLKHKEVKEIIASNGRSTPTPRLAGSRASIYRPCSICPEIPECSKIPEYQKAFTYKVRFPRWSYPHKLWSLMVPMEFIGNHHCFFHSLLSSPFSPLPFPSLSIYFLYFLGQTLTSYLGLPLPSCSIQPKTLSFSGFPKISSYFSRQHRTFGSSL